MSEGLEAVTTTIEDGVAVLRFDDGKVNVLSYAAIDAIQAGLDRAQADATAVCIVGRPGKFSAGFDLSIMSSGIEAAQDLVAKGGDMMMRLFLHPQPVVGAVTGHALAGGALIALCCDVRIGADVPAKLGLNETSIGMPLPLFAIELARDRLARTALVRATVTAETYDPHAAAEVGYLDRVVAADECEAEAIAEARRLGGYSNAAYAQTKQVLRQPVINRVTAGAAEDLKRFSVDG